MEIKQDNIKKTMQELSAASGGSLVKHIHKLQLTGTRSILFVGLGGLGSQTINAIKSVYFNEYEHSENIRFLAVDTDTTDQENIQVPKGSLTKEELFQVFDPGSVNLLITKPVEVQQWVGSLPPGPLDSTGAQGVRQIGRIMLCGTQKYKILRAKIEGLINAIHSPTTPINVVLIAGVSGGTGSGTFIDVAYMIREMLTARQTQNNDEVTFWGAFYTPNVQAEVSAIKTDPNKWAGLKRNGYAAFKELDYFMNNGSSETGARPIYELSAPGNVNVKCAQPLFDQGKAFVIAPNQSLHDVDAIVDAVAHSFLNMFQNVNAEGGEQAVISTFSNVARTILPNWQKDNVGKSNDPKKGADPMGVHDTKFPAFMNYSFSSFGYSSVYFPRDEIMAYCANEVLTAIYARWKDLNNLNQQNVISMVKAYGLATVEQIVEKAKGAAKVNNADFEIDIVNDAGSYPQVTKYVFGRGKVTGTNLTIQAARAKAEEKLQQINNPSSKKVLAEQLAAPLIQKLQTPAFVAQNGPFAAIAVLTGYGEIEGCCTNLKNMAANLQEKQNAAKEALDKATSNVNEQAKILEADTTPTDPEIKVFIDACTEYSAALYDYGFYMTILKHLLDAIESRLKAFNNETFNIYVPVMEQLSEMLNRDAQFVTQPEHRYYENRQVFGMDAYKIQESEVSRHKFIQLFNGYINNARVGQVANQFAQFMLGDGSREKWQKFIEKPEALAEEVRNIFHDFFAPLVSDLLEKFVVLAYADQNDLTAERLDAIWQAADGTQDAEIRDNAIEEAAVKIVEALKNEGAVLVSLEPGNHLLPELSNAHSLILLRSMARLNPRIKDLMGDQTAVGYIDDDKKSVIYSVTLTTPIAIPLVKNFKEFAQEYYNSELNINTSAGRHLDEKMQNWVKYLPEPFGTDAEAFYKESGRRDLAIDYPVENKDLALYREIQAAAKEAEELGILYYDNGPDDCYKLIRGIESTDSFAAFRECVRHRLELGEEVPLHQCLEDAENTYTINYKTLALKGMNSSLQARQQAKPEDPREIDNLCRIIRSNMKFIEAVLNVKDEKAILVNQILEEEITNLKVQASNRENTDRFEERLQLFADMILCGLVEWSDDKKTWQYRRRKDMEMKLLVELKKPQNELDGKVALFLGFVTGFYNMEDELVEVLKKQCDSMLDEGEYQPAPLVIKEADAVLEDPWIADDYAKERDANLNKFVDSSRYKNCYDIPKKYDGKSSTYDNIHKFYKELIDKLNVK